MSELASRSPDAPATSAAAGLVIAVPVATWWLVGDQSTVPISADPDYFRKFDVEPGAGRAAGIGSALVAVIALAALVWAAPWSM